MWGRQAAVRRHCFFTNVCLFFGGGCRAPQRFGRERLMLLRVRTKRHGKSWRAEDEKNRDRR